MKKQKRNFFLRTLISWIREKNFLVYRKNLSLRKWMEL